MASSSGFASGSTNNRGPSRPNKGKLAERYPAFKTAIATVFKRWTALKIAVDQGYGGRKGQEIAAWMETVLEDFFYDNDSLLGEEVSFFLGTIMNQEFNTLVQDSSLEEMGNDLCKYFQMCVEKKEAELLEVLSKLDMATPRTIQCLSRSTHEDTSEEEESDSEQQQF
jgi:pre-rRNA-processing protein TSR2